jgi:hypothetical protein
LLPSGCKDLADLLKRAKGKPEGEKEVPFSISRVRVNGRIRAAIVEVRGPRGRRMGRMSLQQALEKAKRAGRDLVEINPCRSPPICVIMDHGAFIYNYQKKGMKFIRLFSGASDWW